MLIKWHWAAKDNKLCELELSPRLPIIVKGSEWNALLGAAGRGIRPRQIGSLGRIQAGPKSMWLEIESTRKERYKVGSWHQPPQGLQI